MKYKTTNELGHFTFMNAYVAEIRATNGMFVMTLDNVTILPENSCNRDIRKMRTNQLELRILEAGIQTFTQEGYKVYDADGKWMRQEEDVLLEPESYASAFQELEGAVVYSIEKKEDVYKITLDGELHGFFLAITGTGDTEEWERFLSLVDEY